MGKNDRQMRGETLLKRSIVVKLLIVCSCFFADGLGAQERAFRLGVSCPLSGVLAEYGTAVRNGIELARLESPEQFKSIEIVVEDSQWDPKLAVSAFRVLRTRHKVDLVFNWGNPTSEAVAPIAEQSRVPTLVMSSDPRIAAGKRYLVRTINSAAQLGSRLAQEVRRRGYRSVGVIVADNSYVQGVVDGLSVELKNSGTLEVVDRVPLDTQDFRSVVSKMKTRNYDVLGVMLISGQLSAFYKQMKAQDLVRPTFGPDFLDSTGELASAGAAVEGAFHPNFDVTDVFRTRYRAQYGNDSQIPFAANAYDVANLVVKLFGRRRAGVPNGEAIIDAVRNVREYEGANGRMSVASGELNDYYFAYPLVIKEAKNGQSITLRGE
jgi:branched-chain amino acid transport system substrate-binding protein